MILYLRTLYSLSQCSTEVKYQVPTDVFPMCHIEFHMINCGVEKYFSDQHYLSFCSEHHRKLEQSNNKSEDSKSHKSDHLQNECGERFVSHTQHANRKRDRTQKRREKKRIANKQKRDEKKKKETKKDYFHIKTLKAKKRIISRDNISTANAQAPQRCDNVIELFTDRQKTSSKSDELQNECGQKFVSHRLTCQ